MRQNVAGYTIHWKNNPPFKYYHRVLSDNLNRLVDSGCDLSELLFHSIGLTEDDNGPSLFVWADGSGTIFCEYLEVTQWVEYKG